MMVCLRMSKNTKLEFLIAKNNIGIKNDAFLKIKDLKLKPKPENEAFCKELERNCQIYNEKLTNLHQGNNFFIMLFTLSWMN